MFLKHIFNELFVPINELILKKIDDLTIPSKIKEILKEILKAEEQMRILDEKPSKVNLSKILQKYADDDDVKEFCNKHDS